MQSYYIYEINIISKIAYSSCCFALFCPFGFPLLTVTKGNFRGFLLTSCHSYVFGQLLSGVREASDFPKKLKKKNKKKTKPLFRNK